MYKDNNSSDPLKCFLDKISAFPWSSPFHNIYIGNIIVNSFNNSQKTPDMFPLFRDNNCPEGLDAKTEGEREAGSEAQIETRLEEAHPVNADSIEAADSSSGGVLPVSFVPGPYVRHIAIQPDIILTHSIVILKVSLAEGIDEKDLKITINDDHAVLKWPAGYLEQLIPLPGDIIKEGARAAVKNHILEIQIPRRNEGETREISLE